MSEEDLVSEAYSVFASAERPTEFVDPNHCPECSEHNATLLSRTRENISLVELGNPGWDPICFVDENGFKYYFPALVRLTLSQETGVEYASQFLFHVINSPNCHTFDERERMLVRKVLQFLEDERREQLEDVGELDDLLRAKELWSERAA